MGRDPKRSFRLHRRAFLSATLAGALSARTAPSFAQTSPATATLSKERRDALTPDDVLKELKKGQQRFRTGTMAVRDYRAQQRATAAAQYPGAVILGCVDSRAPAEIIFDAGLGDMFNVRIAGNIVDDDVLGSLEFACSVAGAKVVLLLGHTGCGAIKGAIDGVELGRLTGLLAQIRPAVAATAYHGEKSGKNAEYVDAVARTNVRLGLEEIRQRSKILADLEAKKSILLVGAMYDLTSGAVHFGA